jgi:HNH endonuclease
MKRNGSTLFCAWCDTQFYRRFGEQGNSKHQFCSRPCYSEWRIARGSPHVYRKVGARHVHRIIAESILLRPLLPDEVVHHIDHDKRNNDPSNLAVFPSQSIHARCHFGVMSNDELRQFSLV